LQTSATLQRKRRAQVNRKAAESVVANEDLTEREKDFCVAFLHAPNPSQAAMMTGRYETYHAARQAAYEMMQKPAVQEEIKRLKAIKHTTILADGDDVVEMHMRIAFADITQYVEFGRATVPIMGPFGPITVKDPETGETKGITKEINVVRFKESALVDGTILAEVKQGRDGASVKLADRQKSLDFLERYFELNPQDRHKRDYDKARLELDKTKAFGGDPAPTESDGFLEALKGISGEVWRDGDDAPHSEG
jgi:phage terminase small subunit